MARHVFVAVAVSVAVAVAAAAADIHFLTQTITDF
jgi:hypothetical protein